jgi:DNA-binding beta-propeller fold protein YncE
MISVFQRARIRIRTTTGSLRGGRLRRAAVVLLLGALEVACNENYRPVVQPVVPPPPNPGALHYVIAVATNGADVPAGVTCFPSGLPLPCQANPGSASRIDVSGDTYAGSFQTGVGPVHAALTLGGNKLYVANFLEDTVSVNNVGSPTAAGTISLPGGSQPVFLNSTESGNMYVANYGNATVSAINAVSDVVISTAAVGNQPVALAEMPNAQRLYVANQGAGNVTSINIAGFSVAKPVIAVGPAPVWVVARPDNAKVYVLDNSGTIYEIDTLSDLVIGTSSSAGAGSNFMDYDPVAQRLYVTNPANGTIAILNTATDPNPPTVLSVIDLAQGPNAPCPTSCSPVSVTGIGDGSRAYVASYQLAPCPISLIPCVSTQVEVINTGNNSVSKVIPISAAVPVDATNAADCGPQTGPVSAAPWTPGFARFRASVAASGGGTTSSFKVYVSQCDAGSVAVIDTFADNLATPPHAADVFTASLAAPLSSFPPIQVSIQGATFSGGATTYTYTPASGPGLQVGMSVFITGMLNGGNNGVFVVTSLGAGTFSVANSAGVTTTTAQSGSGSVLPPQNPIFVVAGP